MATPPTSSAQAETATPDGGPAPASAPAAPPAKSGKAKRVLGLVALILLGVVAYEGYRWFTFGRFHESTDDAYLQADLVVLQARESGYITEIAIAPNAPVSRGQIIARIDPRDYEIALTAAQNSLEVAKSAGLQLEAQIVAAEATVRQGEALLIAAEAQNDGAQKAYQRARTAHQFRRDAGRAGCGRSQCQIRRRRSRKRQGHDRAGPGPARRLARPA
ncbi:biotin/lipoyl-binding protein [Paracoccus cavernae]|uniref:Biotin/lipoyl-binding protein n=1 Tax=Paracoccus cavernae TaxID=1571207 RepID=A0ABT8DH92_9RHOB|nr:biotin/lipoyl-binding protein [Paracoccus cavernae]